METARTSKRITAFLLDILLVFFIASLVTNIHFINPYYKQYEKAYEKYSEVVKDFSEQKISEQELLKLNNENYYDLSRFSVPYNIAIVVIILLYFVVFQKYNGGQTMGKQIMKIKVVSNDEKEVSLLNYFIRSLPIYYIYIGGIIPLILNSILLLFINAKAYFITNAIISYSFMILGIATFITILVRKDKKGIHDLIAKTKVIEIK